MHYAFVSYSSLSIYKRKKKYLHTSVMYKYTQNRPYPH